MRLAAFILAAATTAVCVGLYIDGPGPVSAACSVFAGLMALCVMPENSSGRAA